MERFIYFAIRREHDSGNEFPNMRSASGCPHICREYDQGTATACGENWNLANPLVRIQKFAIDTSAPNAD
jgi:hypothetical protein